MLFRSAAVGLSPDDMAAVVSAHARMMQPVAALRVCFVECNPHSLDHYVAQIEREFDVQVVPPWLAASVLAL